MILRFGSMLLIMVAILIMVGAVLPDDSQLKIQSLFLNDEQKALFKECEKVRQKLRSQGVSSQFQVVVFKVRDQRLQTDPIINDLKKCFPIKPKSENELEVEVFSSDYEHEISSDLQVQLSVINLKSHNKVTELAFRVDHVPYR